MKWSIFAMIATKRSIWRALQWYLQLMNLLIF